MESSIQFVLSIGVTSEVDLLNSEERLQHMKHHIAEADAISDEIILTDQFDKTPHTAKRSNIELVRCLFPKTCCQWFLLVHQIKMLQHLHFGIASISGLVYPKVPKVPKFHPSAGPDLPPQSERLSSNVELVNVDVIVSHPEEIPLHIIIWSHPNVMVDRYH